MSEYIKREDVLKSRISVLEHIHGIAHTMFVVTVQDINDVPAADVEPVVRGEWIEHDDGCECPVCEEMWNYYDNDTERFDYCPKCGTRLVEHGKERER